MITFNRIDLTDFVKVMDVRRDITPPKSLVLQQVSGMKGSYLTRVETLHRSVEIDILFHEKDRPALRKKVRQFSGVINTDEAKELFFHDEPDVYYWGILTDETPMEEIVSTGTATLQFLLPDPVAWGETKEKVMNVFSNQVTFKEGNSVGVPRYVDSDYGKAVFVEEGTTNLIPRPDTLDLYQFLHFNLESEELSVSSGAAQVKFTRTTELSGDIRLLSPSFEVERDVPYIYSFELLVESAPAGIQLYSAGPAVDDFTDAKKPVGTINPDFSFTGNYGVTLIKTEEQPDGFTRFFIQFPSNFFAQGSGVLVSFENWHGWAGAAEYSYTFKKPQLEAKEHATSFTAGVRQPETLELPTGFNFKEEAGSWEHRFFVSDEFLNNTADDEKYVLSIKNQSGGNAFSILKYVDSFYVRVANSSYAVSLGSGWNEVSFSWSTELLSIVVNGVVVHSVQNPPLPADMGVSIYIGNSGVAGFSNTYHDRLRATNGTKGPDELVSAFNSVWTVEENTSMLIQFDGNLTVLSADYADDNVIDVGGTYQPSPVFTVVTKNRADEFKITLQTDEFLRVETAIQPDDVILIDCVKNLVTINGERSLEFLDLNSLFFDLKLGENRITLTEGLNAEVTVNYTERWV